MICLALSYCTISAMRLVGPSYNDIHQGYLKLWQPYEKVWVTVDHSSLLNKKIATKVCLELGLGFTGSISSDDDLIVSSGDDDGNDFIPDFTIYPEISCRGDKPGEWNRNSMSWSTDLLKYWCKLEKFEIFICGCYRSIRSRMAGWEVGGSPSPLSADKLPTIVAIRLCKQWWASLVVPPPPLQEGCILCAAD